MKKLLFMFAFVAVLFAFTACGSDEPEIKDPTLGYTSWYSDHAAPTDTYFDFNLVKNDTGYATVRMYNIQFKIGTRLSPKFNIRVDAPLTKKGNVYTYEGNNLVPFVVMAGVDVPAAQFIVTNFKVVVDVEKKTYSISFNSHGGSYSNSGTISSAQN